jgi:hypothetical protein
MSKSNLHETAYLKLVFQNIAMANIGDSNGIQPSAGSGSFYIALYSTDPSDEDSGTEATYTGYARVSVVRSAVGWTVTDNVAYNASEILFPTSTGGSDTLTHFGILTALTGGDLIGSGSLTGAIEVNPGDTPRFGPGTVTITED